MPRETHEWSVQRGGSDVIRFGQEILRAEADALCLVADRLNDSFEQAVDLLRGTVELGSGRVLLSGVGKSAHVAHKITGTLNSTGTRAFFLDPVQALHGDLGMVHPHDVAILFSHSGESEEIVRLLTPLSSLCSALIAVTANAQSTLARQAEVVLAYGPLEEVCPMGLAPSASTTAMLALGDALSFAISESRGFGQEDFARFHPAGSLGRKLARVERMMRVAPEARYAPHSSTIREVMSRAGNKGRRTGAVMVLDDAGRLAGIFTDSDLARLIGRRADGQLDRPISEAMTESPLVARAGSRVGEAMQLMSLRKISELPVVDDDGKPLGILDITDLIDLAGAAARSRAA